LGDFSAPAYTQQVSRTSNTTNGSCGMVQIQPVMNGRTEASPNCRWGFSSSPTSFSTFFHAFWASGFTEITSPKSFTDNPSPKSLTSSQSAYISLSPSQSTDVRRMCGSRTDGPAL